MFQREKFGTGLIKFSHSRIQLGRVDGLIGHQAR